MARKELVSVTEAAGKAGKALTRLEETETFAQRLFKPAENRALQAVLSNGNLHVVVTDGKTRLESPLAQGC
jgi:hypothetical protein